MPIKATMLDNIRKVIKRGTPEWEKANKIRNHAFERAERRQDAYRHLRQQEFEANESRPYGPYILWESTKNASDAADEAWNLAKRIQEMTHPTEPIAGDWAWGSKARQGER